MHATFTDRTSLKCPPFMLLVIRIYFFPKVKRFFFFIVRLASGQKDIQIYFIQK